MEHSPVEIWHRVQEVIEEALTTSNIAASELSAIGITNQRETTVVWDRTTGKPFYNAIVWQDARTAEFCDTLAGDEGKDRFRERTGLPIVPYFSGTKVRWILDNVPEARAAADAGTAVFGTIDTWLLWNLTGGTSGGQLVTDVTNASRTLLMNIESLEWDPTMCEALGVPMGMLPEIRSSSEVYAKCANSGCSLDGVPIGGILGDQQAALFGQTCFHPGDAKNTYGTGCFLLMNTGSEIVQSKRGLLTTVAYKIGDQPAVYGLEGSVAQAGSTVQWLRDRARLVAHAKETETFARQTPDGTNGGVYFVPAFGGLFAPHWRSDARGAIVGLSGHASREHIVRAALESTAFQSMELLAAMERECGVELSCLRVDGGMTANGFLMQFQADILDKEVVLPTVAETTCLGAAYAAGLATGLFQSQEELAEHWRVDKRWQPRLDASQRFKLIACWEKAVTRTVGWTGSSSRGGRDGAAAVSLRSAPVQAARRLRHDNDPEAARQQRGGRTRRASTAGSDRIGTEVSLAGKHDREVARTGSMIIGIALAAFVGGVVVGRRIA